MSLFDKFFRPLLKHPSIQKALAEFSDEELENEIIRRRRMRAQKRSDVQRPMHSIDRDNPQFKQLLQYYSNLELHPGASLSEIKRAYHELSKRYHPDKHSKDPEQHKIATELMRSITQAYESLTRYLEG